LLQDDIAKFVSDPASPPRLVNIPEEGNGKEKERCEIGESDDTITIEDTSDEEDGETLQERFQLRSGSADLGCPTSPLSRTHQLAWRLVSLHHQGGRAMWRANMSPKS
jgi:hypothetical protein